MMFYVAVGGMKGTTLNQVFQFWWLWFAMFLVVIFSFGAASTTRMRSSRSATRATGPARSSSPPRP